MDYALKINITNMKNDLEKYGIVYDVWFSESTLHNGTAIKDIIQLLQKNGATYEQDGALWFKATDYDCEKMRCSCAQRYSDILYRRYCISLQQACRTRIRYGGQCLGCRSSWTCT